MLGYEVRELGDGAAMEVGAGDESELSAPRTSRFRLRRTNPSPAENISNGRSEERARSGQGA